MSDAVMGWNPVHESVGTRVGERLNVCPLSSLWVGVGAVRSVTRAKGVAGPLAGSSHRGPQGAYAGRSDGEIRETYICKSLQPWFAPRAITPSSISTTHATGITTLFFKALGVIGKVTEGLGLAHRLQHLFAHGHGNFSKTRSHENWACGSSGKTC